MADKRNKIYLVAIDGSLFAENAFHSCIDKMANPAKDILFLHSVVEVHSNIVQDLLPGAEEKRKSTTDQFVRILREYADNARLLGIDNVNSIVSVATHVGEAICEAAKKHNVDTVVLGTKGLGGLGNLLFGSTSRYVVENANCDVLVVKKPAYPSEIHDSKKKIFLAEEGERIRRVNEYIETREQEKKERAALKTGVVAEEEKERRARGKSETTDFQNISRKLAPVHEELERNRRMGEVADAGIQSEQAREAAYMSALGKKDLHRNAEFNPPMNLNEMKKVKEDKVRELEEKKQQLKDEKKSLEELKARDREQMKYKEELHQEGTH